MKITKESIDRFLEPRKLAIAGVSRNPKKFGNTIYTELLKKGYEVFPVNPNSDEINSNKCFKSVSELPSEIASLLIVTPKSETDSVLREAINKGIKNIWVQQMSETNDTIKIAEEYQIEIIHNKCIFMFAEPTASIHKFHKNILKFFGALPK